MRTQTRRLLRALLLCAVLGAGWLLGTVHGMRLALGNPSVLQQIRVTDDVTLFIVADADTGTVCAIVPATGVSCTWSLAVHADNEPADAYTRAKGVTYGPITAAARRE
jgi:hypothetical protein